MDYILICIHLLLIRIEWCWAARAGAAPGDQYNAAIGAGLPANRASRATGVPSYGFPFSIAKINANHSG